MARSSINFQKTKSNSIEETLRKFEAEYLLPKELRKKNEYWQHEKSELEIFESEFGKSERKGGRLPKFENSCWEAVLNLNKNHTMEDVKKVTKHIEKKFNITCARIAIHRDEGHINERGVAQYNFHAHINFVTYKDSKQNWRQSIVRPKLKDLQTEVAEILKMERGQKNSKAQRLDHKQYRAQARQKAAKQKDLKEAIKEIRVEMQEQKATRADYAELEQLKKELQAKIKAKELTIEELKKELERVKNEREEPKAYKDTLVEEKSDSRPFSSQEEAQKEIDQAIQESVQEKEIKTSLFKKEHVEVVNKSFLAQKLSRFKDRFIATMHKLQSTVQDQAKKIFSLEQENQDLRKENQDLRAKNRKNNLQNLMVATSSRFSRENFRDKVLEENEYSFVEKFLNQRKEQEVNNEPKEKHTPRKKPSP